MWFLMWLKSLRRQPEEPRLSLRAFWNTLVHFPSWTMPVSAQDPGPGTPCTRYNHSLGHGASRRVCWLREGWELYRQEERIPKQPPILPCPTLLACECQATGSQEGHSCWVLLRWLCGEALASCPLGAEAQTGSSSQKAEPQPVSLSPASWVELSLAPPPSPSQVPLTDHETHCFLPSPHGSK